MSTSDIVWMFLRTALFLTPEGLAWLLVAGLAAWRIRGASLLLVLSAAAMWVCGAVPSLAHPFLVKALVDGLLPDNLFPWASMALSAAGSLFDTLSWALLAAALFLRRGDGPTSVPSEGA